MFEEIVLLFAGMMSDRYGTPSSPQYREDYNGISPFSITPYGIQVSIRWSRWIASLEITKEG
jgi:hypothetical protein